MLPRISPFLFVFQVIVEDLSNATEVDYSRKYKTLDPTHRVRNHHKQDNPNNFNRYCSILIHWMAFYKGQILNSTVIYICIYKRHLAAIL